MRVFHVAKCGCDCWFCADCCERKGYNLRGHLTERLRTFKALMMVTLTIDPGLFASARDAYFHVRDKRGVPRLVRELNKRGYLHSARYFCVLEFQEHTEFAHFHVLLDASYVPKRAIDVGWSRLRPASAGPVSLSRPAFGMTRFSKREFEGGAEHASRYATKYLVKTPSYGWPSWVLALGETRRVPRYSTSRGFWGVPVEPPTAPSGQKRERLGRSYAERAAACGSTCNLFETADFVDPATGEITARSAWCARVGIGWESARALTLTPGQSKRRVTLCVQDARVCLQALSSIAGHPVDVIARRRGGPLA